MSHPLRPKELLLGICQAKEYSGKEAHVTLNNIAQEIHKAILDTCGTYDKIELIHVFYDLFDESCYRWILGKHLLTDDQSVIKKVEAAPSIFRYLLEITLLSQDAVNFQHVERKDVLSLVLAAEIFRETCSYSDYLYQNDFAGGFVLNEDGNMSFKFDEKIMKSQDGFIEKFRLIQEKAMMEREKMELTNCKKVSLRDDALRYDELFKETYGINLSTIVDVGESIVYYACKRPYGVEDFAQSALFKKIKKNTSYNKGTIKKALQFLRIDRNMLSKEWIYYRFSDVPVTVSRRPIIQLFCGSGNKGDVVYLGSCALIRSIVFLLTDIDRGIIKLGNVAEEWAQEKGPEFETQVRLALSECGFKVIRVTDPPPNVGEIDAAALYEQKKILLIIEAKAPKLDISMDRAKWHFERSRKWCQQLNAKVNWAQENTLLLANRLGAPHAKIGEVTGIIVTRVPWYVEADLPYKVLSYEEFENFLKVIGNG
jgi:hypothetical protein